MDALTAIITCGLLVATAFTGDAWFLDLALVLGLLAFLTSVAVARFIERRGL
jgi:multisubunit Na+/H+ antiporter MnhF subunit